MLTSCLLMKLTAVIVTPLMILDATAEFWSHFYPKLPFHPPQYLLVSKAGVFNSLEPRKGVEQTNIATDNFRAMSV